MGINIAIHAERFEKGFWNAVSTRIEEVSFGGRVVDSWLESKPLFFDRDRHLSKILGSIPSISGEVKTGQRGLPQDVSNEVLRTLSTWPDDNESFRTELLNQSLNFSPGWLLLEELMKFDWNSKMMLCHGKVEARYAHLFDNGQLFFPNACPIEGLIQFKQDEAYQPFWSFRKKQVLLPEYITVSWIEPYDGDDYHERIAPILERILPKLKTFGDPQSVRIIYWLLA